MGRYPKGPLVAEGKTKKVFGVEGTSFAIFESKPDITAFDNPALTKQFGKKAEYANLTCCNVFELLNQGGVLTAYRERLSNTEFLGIMCKMIPLEVVARRVAVGSYLKRHPDLEQEGINPPHRFPRLVTEFFLKTSKGGLLSRDGKVLVEGLDAENGEEDPFIPDPRARVWRLLHSKKPPWDKKSCLGWTVNRDDVVPSAALIDEMEKMVRRAFLLLEGAWNILGYRLIDLKVEFGITDTGQLVIADVIDNDSWRLRDFEWQELSKQAFRDGEPLEEVERKYGFVTLLTERFRVPKQVIVLWRGSENDEFPPKPDIGNTYFREITCSGHKSPKKCLDHLNSLLLDFPDGGVIVAKVGMSNGLGPMLAAKTSWPVISVPASMQIFPDDVWSSIRMPSDVPMALVASDKNAVDLALNILAAKNPVFYMERQMKVEQFDK